MSLLIWGVVGLMLGLVTFIAAPILVTPLLSAGKQQAMRRRFRSLAMLTLDRGGLVDLHGSGMELKHWSYDKGWNQYSLGDAKHQCNDPAGLMGRFHSRTFGFTREGVDKVFRPSTALVAEADKKAVEEFGQSTTFYAEVEDGGYIEDGEGLLSHVRVPEMPTLVDFRYIPEFLTHSGDSELPDVADTYVKHSLSDYGSRDAVAMMAFVISGVAGLGVSWFATQQGSGGGVDVTSSVPIMLDVVASGVVA